MSRRANGEGSIYPYRNGFAAHVWIVTPKGRRQRKTVYGKTRAEVRRKLSEVVEPTAIIKSDQHPSCASAIAGVKVNASKRIE